MINCPIENTAIQEDDGSWKEIRVREKISQGYGERPKYYQQFGLASHNGIDYAVPAGTPVYAPFDGIVTTGFDPNGYGNFVRLTSDDKQCVLAHLSAFNVTENQGVHLGDLIGAVGNTGNSTGPHLHFGLRKMQLGTILNYDNGNFGYIDPEEFIIEYKGTHKKNSLADS